MKNIDRISFATKYSCLKFNHIDCLLVDSVSFHIYLDRMLKIYLRMLLK